MKKTLLTLAATIAITTSAQAETWWEKQSKPYETLPETHQVCFDKKDAKSYELQAPGRLVLLKADGKFGTDTDGEHWVGYNTYWFNDSNELVKQFNSVIYCN